MKKKTTKKCVLILSGGLDSATLLADLYDKNYHIHAITFDYGQRHKREIKCAKKLVKHFNDVNGHVTHQIIDLTSLKLISHLTDKRTSIPHEHYTHANQKLTIVPNRNAIMLSIAVGVAVGTKANEVFFGAHSNDYAIYPDCRDSFIDAFQAAMRLGNDNHKLSVKAPFLYKKKAEIVRIGLKLGVPYDLTHTCYEGTYPACGRCASCQERLEAFCVCHATDPINYRS
jgi:7-cyano-7-deazaguanine synthase